MGLLQITFEAQESSDPEEGLKKVQKAMHEIFIRRRDLKYSNKIEGYSSMMNTGL